MTHRSHVRWWRLFAIATALLLIPQSMLGATVVQPGAGSSMLATDGDAPTFDPANKPLFQDEENEEELLKLDEEFISKRLSGDHPITLAQAASFRAAAAQQANQLRKFGAPTAGPDTFTGTWSAIGPDPIVQVEVAQDGLGNRSGRIGALAIRPSTGQLILAAAQGGIWLYDAESGTWTPKTDDQYSLSMGALAIAPSDDTIVYAGTGEGALSGDSYFGNGVMKSTDGGETWTHVSGDYFQSVSISRIVVDPADANHLYAATLRGRGGVRRTSPPLHSKFGIWESADGGATWTLDFEVKSTNGATDLEMDPQNPQVMYSSFWGDQVYKSTDGGQHWAAAMNGLPTHFNAENATRFSIGLSHPAGGDAVLYVGTDYYDADGNYHASRLFRSDDEAASWQVLPTTGYSGSFDSVLDYCGGQCFYDNVVEPDPSNPDIVYAGGQFNYGIGAGGIYRSDDGGQTWKNLGYHQHPDFHAFAFDPSNPAHIAIGSDGGVWQSDDRGGRNPGDAGVDDLTANTWENLNGGGLQITQFSSIATNPTQPAWIWGGSQDNGTEHTFGGPTWYDLYGGDGGQVLVDPTDYNYVYGTYYGISPYRATDGGCCSFNSNSYIRTGINLSDRSEFYVPWVMNPEKTDQLFLGTYRLYRTNNAKAPSASNVTWSIISPDLTQGCTGTAPNGARTCAITAIGLGGGDAVYVGTDDGLMWVSPDAKVSSHPTWIRLDQGTLPKRPVASIAVDRSNYRIAYAAYNGFSPATPGRPGHVFKTTDGGKTWANISGNIPDAPVNSLVLDPSFPNTLYAGTDVGPFVTYDGGAHWSALGTDFPIVAVNQLDLDPSHGTLAAGTHGRGAFTIQNSQAMPALTVSKVDAGIPVGPTSNLDYTITVRNIGNADASGVTVTDPIPGHTSFVSADNGGAKSGGNVRWTGLSIAAGDSLQLHFTVSIASALKKKVATITNDGIVVTSTQGAGATGSPVVTPIAPPLAVALTPASQAQQSRVGQSVTYSLHLQNLGYNADTYTLSTNGTFPSELREADCTTPLGSTSVGPLGPGASFDFCVNVDVPADAANNTVDDTTVTATSAASSAVSATATVSTTAAAATTLLVDEDGNGPDVQSYYAQALTDAGIEFNTWDLAANPDLPQAFLTAYTNVVWFTGNAYPAPLAPYESELTAFLDGGGRLMMSGQDILDQTAGQTAFVQNYLHIDWDGTETQNDIGTDAVHGVTGNAVTDGIGDVTIDHSVLSAEYEDEITPNGTATAAFTDDGGQTNALTYSDGYKVFFLAFPFEAYGSAVDKATLMANTFAFFGP